MAKTKDKIMSDSTVDLITKNLSKYYNNYLKGISKSIITLFIELYVIFPFLVFNEIFLYEMLHIAKVT